MKKLIALLLFVSFCCLSEGCNDNSTEPVKEDENIVVDPDSVHVKKPNLYLYPENNLQLKVEISFPLGGGLTTAIPEYNAGWDVNVDTNGIIDNLYAYLFYEYNVPDYHQKENYWLINKDNLEQFFETNMSECGFIETEIKDFTEYWIPRLNDFDYYKIYPQYKSTLDKMSIIEFSKEPDNFYRLQYFIEGTNNCEEKLERPKVEIATRKGFYVLEWGVILQ